MVAYFENWLNFQSNEPILINVQLLDQKFLHSWFSKFTFTYKMHYNSAFSFSLLTWHIEFTHLLCNGTGFPNLYVLCVCRYYLATTHQETYTKIVFESACRSAGDECPFARASIALVAILCDILKIGESLGDQQGKLYPFFFRHVCWTFPLLLPFWCKVGWLVSVPICIVCM